MSVGYIYKIEFPNGKHYIGMTTRSLEDRQKEHKWFAKKGKYNNLVYRALRKYEMVDTFELVEIDTADTLEELLKKEIRYIQEYESYYMDKSGYNMTIGGDGFNGYIHTEEDKCKLRESLKQYHKDNPEAGKEHGERMNQYYNDNPEAREEMSIRMKQIYKDNPEVREKMSAGQLERFKNPEEIKKISEAAKKRFDNLDEREKHCIRMKKRFVDNPEARKEHSEKIKQYYKDHPEVLEKMSEKGKARYEDNPEKRKEHGETIRKYWEENPDARQKAGEAQKKRFENPEEIRKASEATKKYYKDNPEHKKKILDVKGKNKPFDVSKIDGTFIKTFNYVFEAKEYLQKEYNITTLIKICEVLNGNRKSSAGFVFKYQE